MLTFVNLFFPVLSLCVGFLTVLGGGPCSCRLNCRRKLNKINYRVCLYKHNAHTDTETERDTRQILPPTAHLPRGVWFTRVCPGGDLKEPTVGPQWHQHSYQRQQVAGNRRARRCKGLPADQVRRSLCHNVCQLMKRFRRAWTHALRCFNWWN